MPDPIRVFVGCAPDGDDAESQAVLEYTLRRHASLPVEIVWMRLSRDPASPFHGWRTEAWATPFSGLRWAVPAHCGYEGRAIYMDSDVMVLADLADLWRQRFVPGKAVMAKGGGSWRFCVSMWDCAAARDLLPRLDEIKSDPKAHSALCRRFAVSLAVQAFDGDWNCLDGAGHADLEAGAVKALHYTSMPHQPHLRHADARLAAQGRRHWLARPRRPHWRPDLVALFDRLLAEAAASGFRAENYC